MGKKLICIPHAGGDISLFRDMIEFVKDDISCFPLDYAGHGRRNKLPFYDNWDELTRDLSFIINEIVADVDNYALLGYSMGTMAVYELVSRGLLKYKPKHLLLCSHEEPSTKWIDRKFSDLSDKEAVNFLRECGGMDKLDEKMMRNRVFKRVYLEPIRRDYRLISQYRMTENEKIAIPYTVMYSSEDISDDRIHSWDEVFKGIGEYVEFSGKHFFIREHPEEVAAIINDLF